MDISRPALLNEGLHFFKRRISKAASVFRWTELSYYAVTVPDDRKERENAFGMPEDIQLVGMETF